jgi:hypothetical protein
MRRLQYSVFPEQSPPPPAALFLEKRNKIAE